MGERGRSRERTERGRKRERSLTNKHEERRASSGGGMDDDGDMEMMDTSESPTKKTKREKNQERHRELSEARSHSKPRTHPKGMNKDDKEAIKKVAKMERQGQAAWYGGAGEGDNRKSVHLLKWCNTGKKRNGTHYQR